MTHLNPCPRFNNPQKDDYHGRHIEESFVQAIINTCLGRADRALYFPDPGEGFIVLGDCIDIVRGSATRFVDGVTSALAPIPQRPIHTRKRSRIANIRAFGCQRSFGHYGPRQFGKQAKDHISKSCRSA